MTYSTEKVNKLSARDQNHRGYRRAHRDYRKTIEELVNARKIANKIEDIHQRAIAYHDKVEPKMELIRHEIDNLEMVVEDELWTLPKYRELLFIR